MSETALDARDRVLQSALRCMKLVELMADYRSPVSLTELARASDTRKGTIHQQLQTLIAAGWAEQTDLGAYRLAVQLVRVGSRALEQANVGARLVPAITRLAAETGETAGIAIELDGHAFMVQRVMADGALEGDYHVGSRLPLATSASGIALSAFMASDRRQSLRSAGIALPADAELETVRERGFAISIDAVDRGMSAIAVPVRLPDQRLGALSLAAPTFRFEREPLLVALRAARLD